MSGILAMVLVFFALAGGLGAMAYFTYQKKLRRAKAIERGLKMVPIMIHLPPPSSDTQGGSRDVREVMREKTSQAEVLYNLIAGTATDGFKSNFYGQRHIALELIVIDGLVHFYAAVPVALVSVVKKAIQTAYPGARMEEVEDHNIFNQEGRLAATLGGEMVLKVESGYPIATYDQLDRDPMEALLTTVSALEKQDGVAIQIMLRPANNGWAKRAISLADSLRKGKHGGSLTPMDLAKAVVKAPAERRDEDKAKNGGAPDVSQLQLSQVERIEEKTKHPGFEVLVRVIVSTGSVVRSQQLLRDISTTFALFESPGLNGFKFLPALDVQGLVTAFIFRFFPNELSSNVLNSTELATLFHLPDSQFTPTTSVERQQTKQVDGPVQLPTAGLMFGYNEFRGVKKEIRLSPEDRRRHTYILGQTGTGKSTMLENLAVQDMLAGNGFAFIDPHGDSAEKLLALVPKERSEDIIYFNPADTQYPLGLNLFEFNDPAQKDFLVQETINMLYKLYDPGKTGIIGPRYEHWYRNAALTLMADPNGSTFIEIPKVFTDTDYLKHKFKYLKDPTVIDFWTKEMGQTSDYHKSEMLGWFVSKFGAFQNNEMMRNIIGQTKSSFSIREVMDKKKILIVNLSKGRIGELNSQLLGMIFVIKFQAAAMSRADIPEADRSDFALYVDEFQNFSTDSFASILSEARKYRLNLIVANQFIGQLSPEIRDAVFGNIGTIVAHRMGPDDAEFMVKQFAPVFDASDLVNIPNYQAAMRLMIGGLPSQPFSINDSAPLGTPNAELGLAIKQLSAAKYGHEKSLVEAQLVDRMNAGAPVVAQAQATQPEPTTVVAPAPVEADTATTPVVPSTDMTVGTNTSPGLSTTAADVGQVPTPAVVNQPTIDPLPALALAASPVAVPVTTPPVAPAPVLDFAAPAAVFQPAIAAQSQPPIPVDPALLGTPPIIPSPDPNATVTPAVDPIPISPVTLSGPGLMTSPPPIGAPPVTLPPVTTQTDLPEATVMIAQPVAAVQRVAVSDTASDELARSIAAAESTGQITMAATPAAPPIAPSLQQSMTPPPIGAPPIELPGMPDQAPTGPLPPQNAPGTLTFQDITGGKLPPTSGSLDSSLDDILLLETPPLQEPYIGDGQPLPNDPYADIDLLGPSAPVQLEVIKPDGAVPSGPAIGDGQPLPNDPYAEIDVLGAANAEPSGPIAALPTTEVNQPVRTVGAETVPEPVMTTEPEPLYSPAPTASMLVPPVPPRQLAPSFVFNAVPEPAPVTVSEPMAVASPATEVPEAPAPEEPTVAELQANSVPLVSAVIQSSAVSEPMPQALAQPQPVPQPSEQLSVPAESSPNPDWSNAPEPAHAIIEPTPEPAPAPVEPFIHFVDPAAQSILDAPDSAVATPPGPQPTVDSVSAKPSLSGLPPGIALVDSAQWSEHTPAPATPALPVDSPIVMSPAAPQAPAPARSEAVATVKPVADAPVPKAAEPPVSTVSAQPKPESTPAPVPVPPIASVTIGQPSPSTEALTVVEPPVDPAPAEPSLDSIVSVAEALPEAMRPHGEPAPEPVVKAESKPLEVAPTAAAAATPAPPKPMAEAVAQVTDTKPVTESELAPTPVLPPVPEPLTTPTVAPEPNTEEMKPEVPVAEQIKKAEHEIDDLLSMSLIHPDDSPTHHRLPEPISSIGDDNPREAERTAADAAPTVSTASSSEHTAVHHGLKVIEPLEPIVPSKVRFAAELAQLNQDTQPTPPGVAAPETTSGASEMPAKPPVLTPAPGPAGAVPSLVVPQLAPTPASQSKVAIVPAVAKPVVVAPTPSLARVLPIAQPDEHIQKPKAEAASVVKHSEPMMLSTTQGDTELPKAEILTPGDHKEAAPDHAPQHPSDGSGVGTESAVPKPDSKPADEPNHLRHSGIAKRNMQRGRGDEQPAETVASKEEAEHNQPSRADIEAGSLTGTLILPTGEKPTQSQYQSPAAKPKKLAPGEVYVDASGNVMIGD